MKNESVEVEVKKLKQQVEYCLENFDHARNSDRHLCIAVLQQFYGIENSMTMEQFFDVPSFEAIARVRRKFQEEGKYPPTDPVVAIKRGWLEDDWKKAMGYHLPDPRQGNLFGHDKIDKVMQ